MGRIVIEERDEKKERREQVNQQPNYIPSLVLTPLESALAVF